MALNQHDNIQKLNDEMAKLKTELAELRSDLEWWRPGPTENYTRWIERWFWGAKSANGQKR